MVEVTETRSTVTQPSVDDPAFVRRAKGGAESDANRVILP